MHFFFRLLQRSGAASLQLRVAVLVPQAPETAVAHIAAVDPGVTLILQPVTPFGPVRETPSAERLLAVFRRVSRMLPDVRLIPQTHKLIGVP